MSKACVMDENSEVVFQRKMADGVFLMGIESPGIAATAIPGQFVMIRVRDGLDPLLRRPFSICGIREPGVVLVLYMLVGEGTQILSRILPGERISVLGPLGRGFEPDEKDSRALLVSGGIGIAPLIFLAGRLCSGEALFLAGFRSSRQVIQVRSACLVCPEIYIVTEDGSEGERGLVTDILAERLKGAASERGRSSIYACGPVPMLKKVASLSKEFGVPCQVSMEAHMACGLGACQGCAVPGKRALADAYLHVCKDGPVFPAGNIRWESL